MPVAPQLSWVRGGGVGGPPSRPLSGLCGRGGGRGGARWMCAGVAWLKPWVHGLPLGMDWCSRGIMAAIKKKKKKNQGGGQ